MKLNRIAPGLRLMPAALMLALTPLVAACTAGQQVTAADVVQKMRETMKTTQSVQGTLDLSVNINKDGIKALVGSFMPTASTASRPGAKLDDAFARIPDSASATFKVWKQAPDKLRVEIDNASIPEANGAIVVYDGQKVYAYDKSRNTVYIADPAARAGAMPDHLKAALSGADMEQEIDKVLAASEVKLEGTEKVAGLDAYKLDVTPKADAAQTLDIPQAFSTQAGLLIKDLHAVVWVDKDRWLPLKVTLEHPNIGKIEYTASTLEINGTIDPATFVLQVPAGAKTVQAPNPDAAPTSQQTTLPEAKAAAQKEGWSLLEPTYLPAGATLVGVTRLSTPMGGGFMLNYSSPDTDLTIAQGKSEIQKGLGDDFSGVNAPTSDAYKPVTVRGVQAVAFSPAGSNWTSLMWQEKDSGIYVALRGKISVDEAVKIAEGLK
jgi:outer membrane lipoprotein-sorting protein